MLKLFWLLSSLVIEPAHANGQSTHVWITLHAMEHLEEGSLRDFVTSEDQQTALLNGTMFPDGGYAIDDGYGEIAHWEPFQNQYRDWIAEHHSPPWSDAASPHVAFLLGMASHGIADQVFDALFMERSRQEDAEPEWPDNFDLSTDVVMMERVGPMVAPEHWVPSQPLIDIYRDHFEHTIGEDDLDQAQGLLRLAIGSVGLWSEDPDTVAEHEARFPWASAHLDDPDEPGSPPCEGEVLARYWQSVWDRLHGEARFEPPVIRTFPADGSYGHPTDAALVQTRLGLVFSEAIVQDSLTDEHIVLANEDGTVVPTEAWLFYRNHSHVVLVRPLENLAEDADYRVTVEAGIETIDGRVTEGGFAFAFSTAVPPTDSGVADTGADKDADGCGCAASGVAARGMSPWLLLCVLWVRRRD